MMPCVVGALRREGIAMAKMIIRSEMMTDEAKDLRHDHLKTGKNRFLSNRCPLASIHMEPNFAARILG